MKQENLIPSSEKIWKIIDLLKWSEVYLKKKGIKNSRNESEWFLADILDCKRIDLYLKYDYVLNKKHLKTFKNYILRRINNEPFQYIINKGTFYGRDYILNNNVLIPRPETEKIIDLIKKKKRRYNNILDIGTGSGCIAITCILEKLSSKVIGLDNSKISINIAKENSILYKADKKIIFNNIDILKNIPNQSFDIVISNPPYIAKDEVATLQKEIILYEPISSITDHNDGLTFYRRYERIYNKIINKNGTLIIEFGGEKHVEPIKNIFTYQKYNVTFYNDLYDTIRFAEIQLK